MNPLLGWIHPDDRTDEQNEAHARALALMPRFAMQRQTVPKGTKIILTDFLKAPEVIADMGGKQFDGFHQLTGSCVPTSVGNGIACLSGVQRMIADAPQKAIIPWWGQMYAQCRRDEGDRGQGEGAVDSVMGQVIKKGVVDITHPGLSLNFKRDDGWYLDKNTEMHWSDPRNADPTLERDATSMPVGTVAPATSVDDVVTGIINGYPSFNGCEKFVGNGSIKGSGADALVVGHYDGNGGHSTGIIGYDEHPNFGPHVLYWNQWPKNTYSVDPAGGPRCSVWLPLDEYAKSFRMGADNGETLIISHLTTFEIQPAVLNYFFNP